MESAKKRSVHKWMRSLHRDIGFFLVGLTVIYSVSGIVLTYRDSGFLKYTHHIEKQLSPGLSADALLHELKLRRVTIIAVSEQEIIFSGGNYNTETGLADYTGL